MSWISIINTKPEDLKQVLIFDRVNECMIGYYDRTAGNFVGSVDGARISHAIFWKPLPELPVHLQTNLVGHCSG